MTPIATELESLIEKVLPGLQSLTEAAWTHKPSPLKWSRKEVLGHLIDSAQNNIRRFITAQYDEVPTIVYNQDEWVGINNYQQWDAQHIIVLWHLLNKQIAMILKIASKKTAQRLVKTEALHSIEWLAGDYVKHLKYHLHQVLDLKPLIYP